MSEVALFRSLSIKATDEQDIAVGHARESAIRDVQSTAPAEFEQPMLDTRLIPAIGFTAELRDPERIIILDQCFGSSATTHGGAEFQKRFDLHTR